MALTSGAAWAQTDARNSQDLTTLCIRTTDAIHPIRVETAITAAERARGLMGRRALAPDQGMLFVYSYLRKPKATFWMRNTLIPLDIAYLGPQGDIRAIQTMTPCLAEKATDCQSYPAGVHYTRALEMNAGFFADKDIDVGDTILSSDHDNRCEN